MNRTHIENVIEKLNEKILVQGFIENIRNAKAMAFIIVKDITGKLQITIEKEKCPHLCDILDRLTPDSVISVTGTAIKNDYVKLNGIEMLPESIQAESIAEALPIVRNKIPAAGNKLKLERSGIDQRIDYRWIDLRTDENQLIFKVQTAMVNAMRQFLLDKKFLEIHSPKLIGTASESGADVFRVEYFDRYAYLAQSPQFYKQMAMASGFERVFEVGPVFRAEKSYTTRHTTEFTGFDLEMSYINSYRDIMDLEAELLIYVLGIIKEKYGREIKECFDTEVVVPSFPFPVITLNELYGELEKESGYVIDPAERGDLTTNAEKLGSDWAMKKFGHEFLFVTDFDEKKRAFYHMRDSGGVPQGYDLIWRGVEITTGAQREHRFEILQRQAKERGLEEDVKFYLEFFRYGCPPHGGFGLGVDRLTMLMLGLPIKEAMFVFRAPNRLNP